MNQWTTHVAPLWIKSCRSVVDSVIRMKGDWYWRVLISDSFSYQRNNTAHWFFPHSASMIWDDLTPSGDISESSCVLGAMERPNRSRVPTSLYWYRPHVRLERRSSRRLINSRLIISTTEMRRGVVESAFGANCRVNSDRPPLSLSRVVGSTEEGSVCKINAIGAFLSYKRHSSFRSTWKPVATYLQDLQGKRDPKFLSCHQRWYEHTSRALTRMQTLEEVCGLSPDAHAVVSPDHGWT